MEAVQLVADLVKRRKCRCPPDLAWALLQIRVNEVSREELERLKEAAKGGKIKKGKKKKGKTEEERQLEKDFRESSGQVDVRVRVRLQSRMLDALFEVFFRVLKAVEGSLAGMQAGGQARVGPLNLAEAAKRWPLLEPTLAGIEKFAHFMGVEFFGDLLACLGRLAADRQLPTSLRARALQAISGILSGQGASLMVDHHAFHCSLYRALLDMPFAALATDDSSGGRAPAAAPPPAASGSGPAPQQAMMHRVERDAGLMMLKALERGVVDPKSTDITRLSSFAKRILQVAAAVESGHAMGYLAAAGRLLRKHFKLRGMLEGGTVRTGLVAQPWGAPEEEDPAVGGWLGTPLWELALLARHYHPEVARTAASIARMGHRGEASLPPAIAGARGPSDVALAFSSHGGSFFPPPQAPSAAGGKRKRAAGAAAALEAEPAWLAGIGAAPVGAAAEDVAGVEGALAAHFRTMRGFARNAALKRECGRLARLAQLAKERPPEPPAQAQAQHTGKGKNKRGKTK